MAGSRSCSSRVTARGLGGNDIYVSERNADGSWGPAKWIPELNSTPGGGDPDVRDDGLEIFFHRGSPIDLWVATRDSLDAPWSARVNLGAPINTGGSELHADPSERRLRRAVDAPRGVDRRLGRSLARVRVTLATERLTLRPLTDADLPHLVALNGDPEVMALITGRALDARRGRGRSPPPHPQRARTRPVVRHDEDGFARRVVPGRRPGRRRRGRDRVAAPRSRLGPRPRHRGCHAPCSPTPSRPLGQSGCGPRRWRSTSRSRAVMEKLGMRHARTDVRDVGRPDPRLGAGRGRLRADPAGRAHQLSTRSFAAFRLIPLCSRTTLIAWILFPAAARARASA